MGFDEMKLCECGCGLPAPIATETRPSRGYVKGQPMRFIKGHNGWRPRGTPDIRFTKQIIQGNADECVLWAGKVNNMGYGQFCLTGVFVLAHRYSYEQVKGAIPEGLVLDHLCGNPRCVNPVHLEAVTQADNLRRGKGFGGINSRKTTCPNGHAYTDETTLRNKQGWRECRICRQAREKKRVRNRRVNHGMGF